MAGESLSPRYENQNPSVPAEVWDAHEPHEHGGAELKTIGSAFFDPRKHCSVCKREAALANDEGLTDMELDALERIERAAAPAPWIDNECGIGAPGFQVASGGFGRYGEGISWASPVNLSLVLCARSALPKLLAEVRRHRAALAEVQRIAPSTPAEGDDWNEPRSIGARHREALGSHDHEEGGES